MHASAPASGVSVHEPYRELEVTLDKVTFMVGARMKTGAKTSCTCTILAFGFDR